MQELNHMNLYDNVLEMPRGKQIEMAKFFAEGNQELEDLLLFAWDNGLDTKACCAGHFDGQINLPYILFSTTNNTQKFASIVECLKNCKGILVECWTNLPSKDNNKTESSLSVYLTEYKNKITKEDSSQMFKTIKDALSSNYKPSKLVLDILDIPNLHFETDESEPKQSLGYNYPPTVAVLMKNNKLMLMMTAIKGYKSHIFEDISQEELDKLLLEFREHTKELQIK